MTSRLLPSAAIANRTTPANGRQYPGAAGAFVDAPNQDVSVLTSNGWINIGPSGTTAARPKTLSNGTRITAGYHYFDTTLGLTIYFDGAAWRDPNTGSAV